MATATRTTTATATTTIAIAMLEVQRTAAKQRKHIRNRPAAAAGTAGTEASMATEANQAGQGNWDVTVGQTVGQTETGRKKPSAGSWPSW